MPNVPHAIEASQPPPRCFVLRPYQEEALAAIAEARHRGVRRQLVVMPTGSGKTCVFAELIRRMNVEDGGASCAR